MSENLDNQSPESTAGEAEASAAEPQSVQFPQTTTETEDSEDHSSDHADNAEQAPRVARSASNQPLIAEHQSKSSDSGRIQSRPVKKRKRTPRARRMNLSVTRLNVWSVAKVSFMLSVAGGIIQIVAVAVLWGVLSVVGVFDQITQIFSSTGLDAGSFDLTDIFSFSTVISAVTIFSVVEVILFTLLITIISLLYNVVSALVGGVHVTLGDD